MPLAILYGNPRRLRKSLASSHKQAKLKVSSSSLKNENRHARIVERDIKKDTDTDPIIKKGAKIVSKKRKSRGLKKNPKKRRHQKRRVSKKSNPKRRRRNPMAKRHVRRKHRKNPVAVMPKRRRRHRRARNVMLALNPKRRSRKHNVSRRHRKNPGMAGKIGGLFKGENILGLGHEGIELGGLLVGGLAYGVVTGAVVKYLGMVVNPIESVLGKAGPKVAAIIGPAVPTLLVGIPAHILVKKYAKNPYLLALTRGLLAATVVGVGTAAARSLFGSSATVQGIPQLRGYTYAPGSMAGLGAGSSFVQGLGQPVQKADFGSMPDNTSSAADFGGLGRYITAGEAQAMGGYDAKGDFGSLGESSEEEGLGSLG